MTATQLAARLAREVAKNEPLSPMAQPEYWLMCAEELLWQHKREGGVMQPIRYEPTGSLEEREADAAIAEKLGHTVVWMDAGTEWSMWPYGRMALKRRECFLADAFTYVSDHTRWDHGLPLIGVGLWSAAVPEYTRQLREADELRVRLRDDGLCHQCAAAGAYRKEPEMHDRTGG